jgi:putative transposase
MPHRKAIKHVHELGHLHEFTFSTYRRLPLLTNDNWRERLARTLEQAGAECRFQLVAFVFMPEHLHVLTCPVDEQPEFGKYLARIKQPFSKQIKEVLTGAHSQLLQQLTVRERPGTTCCRFWQEGAGYDCNLFSRKATLHAIEYIHENPVRRGRCRQAVDWKWSSARYYLNEPPKQQDPHLPLIHGPPPDLFD